MSSTRTLLSLPEDVLIEILGLLLTDTPRSRLRTAVLRSCKALYILGLPLLYRVVDLRAAKDIGDPEVIHHWETLFGARGTLTDQRRIETLGSSVLHLRLGGADGANGHDWAAVKRFEFRPVQMQHCTSLTLDWSRLPFIQSPSFDRLLASLPITHLEVCLHKYIHMGLSPFASNTFTESFTGRLFGMGSTQPYPDLDTIRIRGPLQFDYQNLKDGKRVSPRISFWDWSFRVLAIDLPADAIIAPARARVMLPPPWANISGGPPTEDHNITTFFQLFFGPVDECECADWWRGLERIELRVAGSVETDFHRRLDIAIKAGPLRGLQKRILPLVVFVDDDGTERGLVDGAGA